MSERLAKFMARSGVCSRRQAEEFIRQGRVTVNGDVVDSPAFNVEGDEKILLDGEKLPQKEKVRLWLYHKPVGLVTTHRDEKGRPTVFDNLPEGLPRVISVGRLDLNSEGLLLLTNDGELSRRLELPSNGWIRRYRVRVHGTVDIKKLQGNYLLVCVEDHGIGIERKDLNHVFDKFAQIENSLSRKVGGSGLGLPIARQLMESHNGAIWCDSEINKGSKFYFVIPVANDRSNFLMIRKQLAQKARSNGSTIAVIRIKSTNEVIENLLRENNLLNKTYMTNSLLEKEGAMTTLSLILVDGDKPSAEFLKKKIDSVVEQNKNLYGECDIMYSYDIEGDTHEKDSYSG